MQLLTQLGCKVEEIEENFEFDLLAKSQSGRCYKVECCHNKLLRGDLQQENYYIFPRKLEHEFDMLLVFAYENAAGLPLVAMWHAQEIEPWITRDEYGRYPVTRPERRDGLIERTVGFPTSLARVFELKFREWQRIQVPAKIAA